VSFDPNGKITQIRQSWDQGSLLKLIDVIGRTGKNWPIRDGKDQIKLIASSVKSAGKHSEGSTRQTEAESEYNRSRSSSTNVTRDPHASLSLFAPRDRSVPESLPSVVAPRASAKPPPRDYHDLFVGNDSDNSATQTPVAQRSESPSKPKGGSHAGKNYAPSRLFDVDEPEVSTPVEPSPQKDHSADHFYRANAAKYQHFDWAEGSEEQQEDKQRPLKEVHSKHGSQWKFDDFNTPAKVIPSKVVRTNEVRHWGNSDDEAVDSPVKTKHIPKPRKDAETNFEFKDDGTPNDGRRIVGRPRGAGQNTGLSLYKDNLFSEDDAAVETGESKPLKPIANIKDRSKDFDSHFNITDIDSPASKQPTQERIGENKAKVLKMMDANWMASDQSPSQKENVPASPLTSRPNTAVKGGPLTEATNTMSNRNDNPKGIIIGGDGMGGKKGMGRQWGIGDESDGEEANKPSKYRTGKTQGKPQATGGDFWDF
jgi:hypothetical protein